MTDEAFVLSILKDGKPHTSEEIRMRSVIMRGHGLTVHSRIAGLRSRKGLHIVSSKVPGQRDFSYQLLPQKEGEVVPRKKQPPVVQAYIFKSEPLDLKENERIVQIIERAEADESLEPAFLIEFSNGQRLVAWGSELRPWFSNG